jgi:hypothetical protein
MSQSPLQKLLLSRNKPAQLAVAVLGAFTGMFIIIGGLQVYRNMEAMLQKKDLLSGDYIVIQKKVGLLNTISGSAPSFDKEDIEEISQIQGIDKVGGFEAGTFKASMQLSGKMAAMAGQAFRSDMFFEAIPDDFVDADPDAWNWSPGDKRVPVIISAEYINLYNSAFARSQGLPVIPESMLKSVTFDIQISGNGATETLEGHIAGFSERINSILVPQSFLNYAESKFGSPQKPKPARLILHSKDPASPALSKALKSSGYELNEEKLKSSELNGILQILISVVSVVGVLIVFLALLGFMQYNQLMAYRSAYEIQTLHWLGYKITALSFPYIRFSVITVMGTFLAAAAALFSGQYFFASWLHEKGFPEQLPGIGLSIAAGFLISLLMAVMSALAAHQQIKQLAK